MSYGYFGATAYNSVESAKRALDQAQHELDVLENEERVLRSRNATAAQLGAFQIRLKKALDKRNSIRAQLDVMRVHAGNIKDRAERYDSDADAHQKQLEAALREESLLRKPQTSKVKNLLAEIRQDRDVVRSAIFETEKTRLGLAQALQNRISRFEAAKKKSIEYARSYSNLLLSKATQQLLVDHAKENAHFFDSNITLDKRELAALKAAKSTGRVAAIASPGAARRVPANLLKHTKRSVGLIPGATLPEPEYIRQLMRLLAGEVPRRPGESELNYRMRLRRYTYRAAIRLANARYQYRNRPFSVQTLAQTAVKETVVTDAPALEQEAAENVFAPAGEQDAVAVVDAATDVSIGTVASSPASVDPGAAAVVAAASTSEFVPSTPAQQASVQQAEDTLQQYDTTVPAAAEVTTTEEQPATPAADTSGEVSAAEKDERPFYKRPVGMAAILIGALLGYSALRGRD
jgi:hypothetical protein